MSFSNYYDQVEIARSVSEGKHRDIIGGLWDEIGALQFSVATGSGLQPHHLLLDIGCGALRGGVHFVRYLEQNCYFGIDINESLLAAGYDVELAGAGLTDKLDRNHLRVVDDFDVSSFGVDFDYAIALSVFTHLPLNSIRVCLERLALSMRAGGKFFATFFEVSEEWETWRPFSHSPGNVQTFGAKDPYHYRVGDLNFAVAGLPWKTTYTGEFGHPRSQKLMVFERL